MSNRLCQRGSGLRVSIQDRVNLNLTIQVSRHDLDVSCDWELKAKSIKLGISGENSPNFSSSSGKQVSIPEHMITKKNISEIYVLRETLGRGTSSLVKRVVRKTDGKEFAAKVVTAKNITGFGGLEEERILVERAEFALLASLEHSCIIKAEQFVDEVHLGRVCLVTEYISGLTLTMSVRKQKIKRFSEMRAIHLSRQLVEALDYLHSKRIMHRDVKPDNIMVSDNFEQLKIIDFNTAKCLKNGLALTCTGTFLYSAPELLTGDFYTERVDVWGLGICIFYMLSGKTPFSEHDFKSKDQFITWVSNFSYKFRKDTRFDHSSDEAIAFVRSCLTVDGAARPSPRDLLKQHWLLLKNDDEHLEVETVKMSPLGMLVETNDEIQGSCGIKSPTSLVTQCSGSLNRLRKFPSLSPLPIPCVTQDSDFQEN